MPLHELGLVVEGVDVTDDTVVDRIHVAFADVSVEDWGEGTRVTIWTDADGGDAALRWAARLLEETVAGATVRAVDLDLVTVSDIGERLGRTAESVRLWSTGARGPGGFPSPLGIVSASNATRVWMWADVYEWVTGTRPALLEGMPVPLRSDVAMAANVRFRRTANASAVAEAPVPSEFAG